jgi:hypothetical protein
VIARAIALAKLQITDSVKGWPQLDE